jgi:ribosomal protein L11 methylase PrmA
MSQININAGSFRDPAGHVYESAGRIYRTVNEWARQDYEAMRESGVIASAIESGFLIDSQEIKKSDWPGSLSDAAYVLEHPRIPYVSYPYEWSFSQLKAAALHHLDFQTALLEKDVALSDATAYNIQFIGPQPVFIDLLSLTPYRQGEFWLGHRQFCEQFLNPLLLRAMLGIPHNGWYRGALEGIPTVELARLIPMRKRLSWNVLSHVVLHAKLERSALRAPESAIAKATSQKKFSKAAYRGILLQLRNWISRLQPADTGKTVWGDYAQTHTYTGEEAAAKRRFVAVFAEAVKPKTLVDIGCNTGDYSLTALEGGAEYVIGFDFDLGALDLAFSRTLDQNVTFLPLWLDAANPSPNQGWRQAERTGFAQRTKADAMVSLAFVHHLAITKNIPLPQVIDWLIAIAPQGVIEFVPKNDSTVQKMLALREDIFDDYSAETFTGLLKQRARIVSREVVSKSNRTLFWYERF